MKFELDPDERKRHDDWVKAHLDEKHGGEYPYTGAIGGLFTFTITPTSMGTILGVECGLCKRNRLRDRVLSAALDTSDHQEYEQTLTDFSEW